MCRGTAILSTLSLHSCVVGRWSCSHFHYTVVSWEGDPVHTFLTQLSRGTAILSTLSLHSCVVGRWSCSHFPYTVVSWEGDPVHTFLTQLCRGKAILQRRFLNHFSEVVRQPLPGLLCVMPGYSMGLIAVRQPEPGLRRVTPLALATRLLGNSQ